MATATKKSPAYDKGYREGRADKGKKKPMEMEPGEGKAHEMKESPQEEATEGPEPDDAPMAKKGKRTKAPMDGEGCSCGAKGRKGKKCSCDGGCGYGKKMDSLTAPEYLDACELGINRRSNAYIRARLDAEQRLDLKCGKGAISQGEKCRKGAATAVRPEVAAASRAAASIGTKGGLINVSSYKQTKGPNALVQAGQALKGGGLGVLEAVKWTSGYNLGKHIATNLTKGKNEKANTSSKVGSIALSGVILGPQAAFGAARRLGAFGETDLQNHARNQKKEKAWRRSVGYRDSIYASGFTADTAALNL